MSWWQSCTGELLRLGFRVNHAASSWPCRVTRAERYTGSSASSCQTFWQSVEGWRPEAVADDICYARRRPERGFSQHETHVRFNIN